MKYYYKLFWTGQNYLHSCTRVTAYFDIFELPKTKEEYDDALTVNWIYSTDMHVSQNTFNNGMYLEPNDLKKLELVTKDELFLLMI